MNTHQKQQLISDCNQAIQEKRNLSAPVDFYSVGSARKILKLQPGEFVRLPDGTARRVGETYAEFTKVVTQMRADKTRVEHGIFSTTNPRDILLLLQRVDGPGDVCLSDTFQQLIKGPEARLEEVTERAISSENRLIGAMEELRAKDAEIEALNQKLEAAKAVQEVESKPSSARTAK